MSRQTHVGVMEDRSGLRYECCSWGQPCVPRAGGGRLGGEVGALLSHSTVGGAGGGARHHPRRQD